MKLFLIQLILFPILYFYTVTYCFDIQTLRISEIYQHHKNIVQTFLEQTHNKITQFAEQIDLVKDEEIKKQLQYFLQLLKQDTAIRERDISQQLQDIYNRMKSSEKLANKFSFHTKAQTLVTENIKPLENELLMIKELLISDQRSKNYKKYKKDLEQGLKEKQYAQMFFHIVQQALPRLRTIQYGIRTAAVQFLNTKMADSAEFMNLIKKYSDIADIIATAYEQSGMQPNFNDQTNITRVVYSRFIKSCIDDLTITNNVLQRLFIDAINDKSHIKQFIEQFYEMQERCFGKDVDLIKSSGYQSIGREMTQTLFNEKAPLFQKQFWREISTMYTNMAINFLNNCVQAGVAWNSKLKKIFDMLETVLKQIEEPDPQIIKNAARSCLSIIERHAKKLIKEIRLENFSSQLATIADLYQQAISYAIVAQAMNKKVELEGTIKLLSEILSKKQRIDEIQQRAPQEAEFLHQELSSLLSLLGFHPQLEVQIPLGRVQASVPPENDEALEQQADDFIKQGEYSNAVTLYKNLMQQLQKAGKTKKYDQIRVKYLEALSKSLVIEYMQNVLPNEEETHNIGFIKIGNLNIPKEYQLARFVQAIPQKNAQNYDSRDTKKLIDLAFYLQASKQLMLNGIDVQNIFDEQLRLKKKFNNVSEDQQKVIQNILDTTTILKNRLTTQLKNGEISLLIERKKDDSGIEQTNLIITYYAVFPVVPAENSPLGELPYPGYPVAQSFLVWAQKIADPTSKSIQYGQQELPSAQMPDKAKILNLELGKTFLSATHLINQRIKYITEGKNVKDVDKTLNKNELDILQKARTLYTTIQGLKDDEKRKASLKDYIYAYKAIKSYIDDGQITYFVASDDFLKDAPQLGFTLNALESDAYQKLAEYARIFLIGNPQDAAYLAGMHGVWSGILADVMKYYKLAYGLILNKKDKLLQEIVSVVSAAGQILVNEQKLLASRRYFEIAIGAALAMEPLDNKVLNQVSLNFLYASYGGASELLLSFRDAYSNPVVVDYQDGRTATFSFDDFIKRIVVCPAPEINKFECELYEQQRTALLDALVYFQEAASWSIYLKDPQAASHPHDTVAKGDKKQNGNDENILLQGFKKKYNISFDSLATTKAFLVRSDLKQVLSNAFQEFKKQLMSNEKNYKQAFDFFDQWNNQLFLAFMSLYTQWYFKGAGSLQEQFSGVLQMIKLKQVNILAPAEQWIG